MAEALMADSMNHDVVIAAVGGEAGVALDGMDLSGNPARDGGGIARSGADLENLIARLEIGRFEH